MKQSKRRMTGAAISALLWMIPTAAAAKNAPDTHNGTAASTKTVRTAWPPETLKGTIMTVDAGQRLLIVKGPDNVPFDMKVNHRTRIESGNQTVALSAVSSDVNQPVSVRYTPERSGDIAQLIHIGK